MEKAVREMSSVRERGASSSLREQLDLVSEKCIKCKLCQEECAFLRKYGKPKDIADSYNASDKAHQAMPFECSLCGLCAAVCPVKIDPSLMFLEMRREAVRRGGGDHREHSRILGYEKRGTSKRYSYYALPKGCDTVFFPGCALSGTRPDKVIKLYDHLKQSMPSLGIVLDCCTQPSHDLGRETHFNTVFGAMRDFLSKNGIKNVIVACPSCHKVFRKHGKDLIVRTAYEILSEKGLPESGRVSGSVTVHDSCAVRFEEHVHSAVRDLILKKGLTIEEMKYSGTKTFCCGEGGSVGFLSPDLAATWVTKRKGEVGGRRTIAYCAGCANSLNSSLPISHVLDLLFEPEVTMAGSVKFSKPPFTYFNRLKLKRKLKKMTNGSTHERTPTETAEGKKGGRLTRILFLLVLVAAILAIRFTGMTRYLDQDILRHAIESHGTIAPVIYVLIYTIAPSLFLPGLPITIAGGILFGPVWGVVYTIIGATAGACVAFIISRYIARDWVEKKVKGPKLRRLDEGVEQHGWKIVAFTRLIPLFPFNLLNYAFGLTKIKFLHYAIASFIFMLPATIAFIVFSSSLLDVIRGKISPAFVIGLALVILISLIPLFYRRYKTKKGKPDLL